ncbi:MAG: DUF1707 domain-containing protein [Actinomycetota bacterium]|nr:DUF1707 domain-containing protein [Actinomycetota bacterium]
MEGSLEQPDPQQLRISDADRHRVAELLREAAGDGRIDLTELDERLDSTYAAKTYADLVPITRDLPERAGQQPVVRGESQIVPGPVTQNQVAVMSGFDRRGVWVVPEQLNIFALMGGASLDMRRANFAAREVVVTVTALMGGVDIVVSPHVNVVMDGFGIMGGFSGPSERVPAELDASSPTVRVRGFTLMSGVSVTRRAMPEDETTKRLPWR